MRNYSTTFCCAVALFLSGGFSAAQQQPRSFSIGQNYAKTEVRIPMRDGVKLHTTLYVPRDQSRRWPIMLNRTPYSTQPYGQNTYAGQIGPSRYMEGEGYIFVKQDVRGRWMSEGDYDNMRPHVDGDAAIDESSDTFDTIEWLLANVRNHNGRVGMWGISYPGFYTAAALPEHHPALLAASPQAPISDFFFDDFHHHGAYLLSYFLATSTFGYQHNGPSSQLWYRSVRPANRDAWNYYLNMVPVADAYGVYGPDNFFWKQLVEHPNYDEFWQKRNILPHLKNIKTNVLTVGGWFDAEDLYGPLKIYREIEKNNSGIFNTLVMGPWSHGDWARNMSRATVGNVSFGENVSDFYQRNIEAPFFRHFLKDSGDKPAIEAMVYDTGLRKWSSFDSWPPQQAQTNRYYLNAKQLLSTEQPDTENEGFVSFVSDPRDPVPYRARKDIRFVFTPRAYMSDDQRFASSRDDVLVFQTPILQQPVTFAGDILANLNVSTTGTDADWIVKLIDVYPDDYGRRESSPTGANLSGYQQMVRSEVMRGRFRNSYSSPERFEPGKIDTVRVPLQDVYHTFRPGHRIMVHVQSTWFPLIDRNPQSYVENIFKAPADAYQAATHRVYHSGPATSWIEVKQLK
jgi:putative CocE/NonD family hydrolase